MLCVYTVYEYYIYILVHAACDEGSEVFGQILWSVALFGNTGEVQVSPYFGLHTPGKTQDIARLGTYELAVSFHSRILVSEALNKLAKKPAFLWVVSTVLWSDQPAQPPPFLTAGHAMSCACHPGLKRWERIGQIGQMPSLGNGAGGTEGWW